jgi:hypothetical protein
MMRGSGGEVCPTPMCRTTRRQREPTGDMLNETAQRNHRQRVKRHRGFPSPSPMYRTTRGHRGPGPAVSKDVADQGPQCCRFEQHRCPQRAQHGRAETCKEMTWRLDIGAEPPGSAQDLFILLRFMYLDTNPRRASPSLENFVYFLSSLWDPKVATREPSL